MFNEDPTVYFADFGETSIYSYKNMANSVLTIIDKDAERSPGDLFSGSPEKITAIDIDVTIIGKPKIGAVITAPDGECYLIDDVISNDGVIARVSVKNG